jgi:hypothetical protein
VLLLYGCGSGSKFASSFGKRKYTKGFFWNNPGGVGTVSGNVANTEIKKIEASVQIIPVINTDNLQKLQSVGGELYCSVQVSHETKKSRLYNGGRKVEYCVATKAIKKEYGHNETKENNSRIDSGDGNKEDRNGHSNANKRSFLQDIVIWTCIAMIVIGSTAMILGIASFFFVIFHGISAWFLALIGAALTVAGYLFIILAFAAYDIMYR